MGSLVKRLKGLVGITGLWVTCSVPLGLASDAFRRILRDGAYDITDVQYLLDSSLTWALQGFATGLIFAALISLTERGRDASAISTSRSVVNGFVAGGLGALGGFLLLTGTTFQETPLELVATLGPFMFASALVGAAAGYGVASIARTDRTTPDAAPRPGTLPMPSGVGDAHRANHEPAHSRI